MFFEGEVLVVFLGEKRLFFIFLIVLVIMIFFILFVFKRWGIEIYGVLII